MKKSFIYVLLCSLSLLFTASTCAFDCGEDVEWTTVTLENQSDEEIRFAISGKPITPHDVVYNLSSELFYSVPCNGISDKAATHSNGDMVLYISLFKQSTLDKYTKEQLAQLEFFDKQYALTYEELLKTNFRVIYTGE